MRRKLKIAVLGYIVRGPLGGLAWHHLQYVLGLKKMGHDVLFVEDSDDYPACYDPCTYGFGVDPGYGLGFIKTSFDGLGLRDLWAYFDVHTNQWHGAKNAEDFVKGSDLLLNLSGANPLREWSLHVPKRVFVDTDPAFVQIRHLTDKKAMELAKNHNVFLTFGENFGNEDCLIPDDGFDWKPTRQPVVLDVWQASGGNKDGNLTTVMQWDSYEKVLYHGREYGMKSTSFAPFLEMPLQCSETFEIAVGSANAPFELLVQNGWNVLESQKVTESIWTYKDFVENSKAEFSVAKHGYVESKSGWFSERSAVYLASGRPVITQETGFSKFIETGKGLMSFSDQLGALDAIERINADYDLHCSEARRVAEEFFGHEHVLQNLLEVSLS